METRHVFIVGSGRSGTTLLVNILNKHPEICISVQTHYLGHVARPGFRHKMKDFGDLRDDDNVRRLADFIKNSRPYGGGAFWHWVRDNVETEALVRRILNTDRSERAIFAALMQLPAKGKPILGEKTPDHIHYVSTLLEWFPEARIVHSFRDPRAVFVSELHYRWNQRGLKRFPYKQLRPVKPLYSLFILLHMSIEWFLAARYHFRYKERYPDNYYLLKFEDLVLDPECQLKQLCDFLGVEFQDQMLEQTVTNTGFASRKGKAGFDAQAVDRWKGHISPLSRAWFLVWGRKYLKAFGYTD
jgi:hypothetical protein